MYPAIIAPRKSGSVQTGRQRRKVIHRISMGIVDNGRVRGNDHQVTRSGGPRNIREVVVAESERRAYARYVGMFDSTNCWRTAPIARVNHPLCVWLGSCGGGFGQCAMVAPFAPGKVPD